MNRLGVLAAYKRPVVAVCVATLAEPLIGCGSSSPTAPVSNTTSVQLSAGAGTNVSPGETRQLTAMAVDRNGSSTDVTSQATWQSSAPSIATVSATGLLTAAAEGSADISATYQNVRGSLRLEVNSRAA